MICPVESTLAMTTAATFPWTFFVPGNRSLVSAGLRLSIGVIGGIWSKRNENRTASSSFPEYGILISAAIAVVAAGEKIVPDDIEEEGPDENPVEERGFKEGLDDDDDMGGIGRAASASCCRGCGD